MYTGIATGCRAGLVFSAAAATMAWSQPCTPQLPAVLPYRSLAPSCDGVDVFWFPLHLPPQGTSYRVYRTTSHEFVNPVVLAQIGHPGSSIIDHPAAGNTSYYYWVAPCVDGCCSPPTRSAYPLSLALVPAQPALSSVSNGTWCNRVSLSWSRQFSGWREVVYRLPLGSTQPPTVIAEFPEGTSDPSFLDHSAEPGVSYEYWIRWFAGDCGGLPSQRAVGRRGESPPEVEIPAESYGFIDTGIAKFECWATGASEFRYQWRRHGQPLVEGDRFVGTQTSEMTIQGLVESDAGEYDVIVSSDCGDTISSPTTLVFTYSCWFGCRCDYNRDGGKDGSDFEAFLADWEAGNPCADWNTDGAVDGTDLAEYADLFGRCDC